MGSYHSGHGPNVGLSIGKSGGNLCYIILLFTCVNFMQIRVIFKYINVFLSLP